MREADFYEKTGGGTVRCLLCAHRCLIADGRRGACAVRENRGGVLYSLVYGKAVAEQADPIEKKPLFHFYPGSYSYSIAAPGCNFRCRWCQNWSISQTPGNAGLDGVPYVEPEEIVRRASSVGCASISYTYTEPTVFLEYALDSARLAREAGLANVFVTNGYMTEEALDALCPLLDAANVDLKSFNKAVHAEYVGARLPPVLDSMRIMKERGVWLEVTTLVIPGLNDSDDELRDIGRFICNDLGPETPWHISRFFPNYKMEGTPPTPEESLCRARDLGREQGLKHVYVGNISVPDGDNTFCPGCERMVVERSGYTVLGRSIVNGACAHCGTSIAGRGMG